jgi:alpha-L-fucosidase
LTIASQPVYQRRIDPAMNRREFLTRSAALAIAGKLRASANTGVPDHQFPPEILKDDWYVETRPIPEYRWAPASAYEAFRDMKFGIRLHWGIYSIWHRGAESWPFLGMSFEERQAYNQLYKTWDPAGFDAAQWMSLFSESGLRMFAFTSKHHEGFSMFDSKTRVRQRVNWTAPGGPRIEPCDLAYSIMETPFRRDIIKELCDAAHKRNIKVDLYFSHPDWYDADFRPYGEDPLQVPDSPELYGWRPADGSVDKFWAIRKKRLGDRYVIVPDPTPAEVDRMVERHRRQLTELLTNYGTIDMLCLDIHWGPKLWPRMRETILKLREIQPNVMLRNRGIGNYGDYYTPERVVPSGNVASEVPWMVIYPLGSDFSYEPDPAKHKGTGWIVQNLVDSVAKGGGFMVGVGPSAHGDFHPEAARQLRATGEWLKVNGEGIYATRAREGSSWAEGETIRFTRSKDRLFVYAHALNWPGKQLLLTSVKPKSGSDISMLGLRTPLKWNYDAARGLSIMIPDRLQNEDARPCQYAWTFKVEV